LFILLYKRKPTTLSCLGTVLKVLPMRLLLLKNWLILKKRRILFFLLPFIEGIVSNAIMSQLALTNASNLGLCHSIKYYKKRSNYILFFKFVVKWKRISSINSFYFFCKIFHIRPIKLWAIRLACTPWTTWTGN
jgi:hypothetical protein